MSLILNLDTATAVCSVALAEDCRVISQRTDLEGRNHAALLTAFIDEMLREAGIEPAAIDAVGVSKGPGSYTGLRIGVSTAKGIAYALSVPLLSAGTLEIMANGYLLLHPELSAEINTLLCPLIDARRMEVYTACFDTRMNAARKVTAEIVNENSFSDLPGNKKIIFFGDGAAKCEKVLSHENAVVDTSYTISATHMTELIFHRFREGTYEDVAYFEPFYLKDFIATIPKNKII